jgi:hypothetical protein
MLYIYILGNFTHIILNDNTTQSFLLKAVSDDVNDDNESMIIISQMWMKSL